MRQGFPHQPFDGLRYTEGRRYEDLDIFYKLYWRAGAIVHDTAPIYFYRQHTASFVHRWDSHRADVLDVTDDIVTWAKGLGDAKLVNAAMDRRLSARFNILVTAARTLRAAQRDAIPTDTDPTQAATAYDVAALQATMARCRKDIAADRRRALWDIHTRLRNRLALLVPTGILAASDKRFAPCRYAVRHLAFPGNSTKKRLSAWLLAIISILLHHHTYCKRDTTCLAGDTTMRSWSYRA